MNNIKAKWITPPAFACVQPTEPNPNDAPVEFQNCHFHFTTTVNIESTASHKYEAVISADDYYVLYINGNYICQGPAPSYLFRYAWNQVDISLFMTAGENEIDVHVYSQGLYNRVWESADLRCALMCEIRCDGDVISATDGTWMCAENCRYTQKIHTGYKTAFLEHYDCRIPLSNPEPATVIENPAYELDETPVFVISIKNKKPVHEWMLLPREKRPLGGMLYDFGCEIAAHLRLSVVGHDGDRIRVLCGEELMGDVNSDSTAAADGVRYNMRCNCTYDETITLAEGVNEIRQFDYKAFRYVEIEPISGSPAWNISADARYAPFNYDRVRLKTNDRRLGDVFRICLDAVKVGAQEVFVDCPHREKGQYAGDLTITSHSHLWLTGDAAMLRRAIVAQLDSARYFPGIRGVTPGAYEQKIADYSLQLPILLLRYYSFTKDLAFLKNAMPTLTGMIEYFKGFMNAYGLLENVDTMWNLVDWPANLRDGYDFRLEPTPEEGPHCVLNAFWAGCLGQYEYLCKITGMEFTPTAEKVKSAFNEAFFDFDKGQYRDSRKTNHSAIQSNVIPLYYGLYPDGFRDALAENVISRGIRAGVYMTYFMLHGLCRAGYQKEAYGFLVCDEAWVNMVKEGASTCYEAWGKEQKWNTSLCHPWASAPISVLIEGILGYQLDGTKTDAVLPDGVQADVCFVRD